MHRNIIAIVEDNKLPTSDAKCKALKKYLESNPDTNLEIVNSKEETALIVAARLGETACLVQLIAAKANIHHVTSHEMTPLMIAALYGQTDCLLLLLKKGASINAQDIHGHTALDLATESKEANACVRLLLAAHASPSWEKRSSKTFIDNLYSVLKNFDINETLTRQAYDHLKKLKTQQQILSVKPIKLSNRKSVFTTVCLFQNKERDALVSKGNFEVPVNVKP